MYNKDIKDYLHVLRTREPRPPYAEMARLVANAPVRSPAAIPLFAKFAGALLLGGVLAAGAWVLSAKHPATTVPTKNNLVNASSPQMPDEPHESFGSLSPKHVLAKSNKSQRTNSTEPEGSVLHNQQGSSVPLAANDDSQGLSIHLCAMQKQASSIQPIAQDTRPIPPIAIPTSDEVSTGSFFSTLGGAISRQFSAPFQQTSFSDAFLGVGYNFSSNSSLRLLAGEEVFSAPSSTTTNSISFHDTTFVHDGQSYQNVLGEIQSVNPPALTRVYWLGVSYRYTIGNLSNIIRPFAEVMAGGSTDGFLTHQSLGAEFTPSSTINLDLLFEAHELIPQNSGWLTKAGLSAAVSYCW